MKTKQKEKILSIPVIGHLAALGKLPRMIKTLQELMKETDRLKQLEQETESAVEERNRIAEERWTAATATFDSLGGSIRDVQEQASARDRASEEQNRIAEERWTATTETFESLGENFRGFQRQMEQNLRSLREETDFTRGFMNLLDNGEDLSLLRSRLSIHPIIWGSTDRLSIHEDANVNACLFNTNSGRITVGPYTFAGPGVSLIAGNHDMALRDFPRRDLEQSEGCDIVIGRGVWLCANCTVLGPCRIENHAVIAAGAVVVPGTVVEEGSVYAGIPAKKIRRTEDNGDHEKALREAFRRFDGYLFTEGWYTAETVQTDQGPCKGHWMIHEEAELMCEAGVRTLQYLSPLADQENRIVFLSMNDWHLDLRLKARGDIQIPADAFQRSSIGTLRLKISQLTSGRKEDPRRLGVFIWSTEREQG